MPEINRSKFTLHAEIPVLLIFFALMVSDAVNTNFIIYRTCYVVLGYNQSECAKLGSRNMTNATHGLEETVEPYANLINMVLVWPAQIFPAILCLFVGPWSDSNGRKPVLISAVIGFTVATSCQVIIALIPYLSPWYAVIPSIAGVAFGGFAPFLTLLLCHITDVTTESNRGFRIGVFEGMIALGSLLGTISSSFIFEAVGYAGVYGISTTCNFLALLYILCVMPETIFRNNSVINNDILSLRNVQAMCRSLVKKRANHIRSILLLSMAVMILYVMASNADSSVMFFYVREKFNWDLRKFTLFISARNGIFILGTVAGLLLFQKLLKFHETTMWLIGFGFLCTSAIMQGLAEFDWQIYLAAAVRCVSGIVGPMCRSFMSKCISEDETGKIFSIGITLETMSIVIGAPVFSLIYNGTISTFPGAFNLVTAGILIIAIILTITVIILKNKSLNRHNYQLLINECM